MWQKAIVKMVRDERNKFMIGKEVWVEGPPSDNADGRFIGYTFSHKDPTIKLPSFSTKIDYKTNVHQDGDTNTQLGMLPYMLELLPVFKEERPDFVPFSEWSKPKCLD